MKITRRQEEFIAKLVDLSDEFDGPIHYSILAEHLRVSPFTAYDMLCVLEEKGLVTSEYHLAADKSGPGRAERLFFPARSIEEHKVKLANKYGGQNLGKEEFKRFVLTEFQSGEIEDKKLAEELLVRVTDIEHAEISFCVEIMTIVIMRLQRTSGRQMLLEYLPKIMPANNSSCENLSLLGGFALGILAQENSKDEEWIHQLFIHIQQYQNIVKNLNPSECDQLAQALSEVCTRLSEDIHEGYPDTEKIMT
jgi:hypothetical protein